MFGQFCVSSSAPLLLLLHLPIKNQLALVVADSETERNVHNSSSQGEITANGNENNS